MEVHSHNDGGVGMGMVLGIVMAILIAVIVLFFVFRSQFFGGGSVGQGQTTTSQTQSGVSIPALNTTINVNPPAPK